MSTPSLKILFVCRGNRMRSVVAEALYRRLGGQADSAGIKPARRISRIAKDYLKKEGALEFCKEKPEGLEGRELDDYDLIVLLDKHISKKEFTEYHHRLHTQHFPDPWLRPFNAQKIYRDIKEFVDLIGKLNKNNLESTLQDS